MSIAAPTVNVTPEQIAKNYAAAMDSVRLINGGKPENMYEQTWADCVSRNKAHLRIMLSKPYWTTEDLEPLRLAAR